MEPLGTSTPPISIPPVNAPSAAPVPPTAPPSTYLPPVIMTPSVYEAKPGLARERSKGGAKTVAVSIFILLFIVIAVLYFWGAHLTNQGA